MLVNSIPPFPPAPPSPLLINVRLAEQGDGGGLLKNGPTHLDDFKSLIQGPMLVIIDHPNSKTKLSMTLKMGNFI